MRNTLILLFAGTSTALLAGCGNGTLVEAQREAIATLEVYAEWVERKDDQENGGRDER